MALADAIHVLKFARGPPFVRAQTNSHRDPEIIDLFGSVNGRGSTREITAPIGLFRSNSAVYWRRAYARGVHLKWAPIQDRNESCCLLSMQNAEAFSSFRGLHMD